MVIRIRGEHDFGWPQPVATQSRAFGSQSEIEVGLRR